MDYHITLESFSLMVFEMGEKLMEFSAASGTDLCGELLLVNEDTFHRLQL